MYSMTNKWPDNGEHIDFVLAAVTTKLYFRSFWILSDLVVHADKCAWHMASDVI